MGFIESMGFLLVYPENDCEKKGNFQMDGEIKICTPKKSVKKCLPMKTLNFEKNRKRVLSETF